MAIFKRVHIVDVQIRLKLSVTEKEATYRGGAHLKRVSGKIIF